MRYTFDQAQGLLYVYLREGSLAEQVELPDGSVADVDDHGGLVGLEVFNIAEWRPELAVKTFDLTSAEEKILMSLRVDLAQSSLTVTGGQLITA